MKLTLFTFLILSAIAFVSCNKHKDQPDIKQYDQDQIQSYISTNSLSGMQKDTTSGDTTGIWYKIITPGSGKAIEYSDQIAYVYTARSFDGKFIVSDTVVNHYDGLLGHVVPNGLMLGIHNLLKYKGGKMRVLVPSHLAYGPNGAGTGSISTANRIAGNQCLDYTIYLINDQVKYDELVIKNYMTANGLTGFSKTADGLYYKVTKAGNADSVINNNSSVTFNYTGKLMDNVVFDDHSATTATFNDLAGGGLVPGFSEGLKLVRGGGAITLLIPSRLGYGTGGSSGAIPVDACLRFDITNVVVTNY